jgi:hypothetical protein
MTLFLRQLACFFCGALLALAVQAQPLSYRVDKSFLLNAPEALTVNQLPQQTLRGAKRRSNLRHCEARSAEAIHVADCFASLAMTKAAMTKAAVTKSAVPKQSLMPTH